MPIRTLVALTLFLPSTAMASEDQFANVAVGDLLVSPNVLTFDALADETAADTLDRLAPEIEDLIRDRLEVEQDRSPIWTVASAAPPFVVWVDTDGALAGRLADLDQSLPEWLIDAGSYAVEAQADGGVIVYSESEVGPYQTATVGSDSLD